jgi:hypothetical protein
MSGGAGGNASSNGDPYRHAYPSNGAPPVSNSDGVIRRSPNKTRPSGPGAYARTASGFGHNANLSDNGGMSQENFYEAYRDLVEKSKRKSIATEIAILKKNAAHLKDKSTWKKLLELEKENKAHNIQAKIERGEEITEEEHTFYQEAPLPNYYRPREATRVPANSNDGYEHHPMPMPRGGKRKNHKRSRKFRGHKSRRTRRH